MPAIRHQDTEVLVLGIDVPELVNEHVHMYIVVAEVKLLPITSKRFRDIVLAGVIFLLLQYVFEDFCTA